MHSFVKKLALDIEEVWSYWKVVFVAWLEKHGTANKVTAWSRRSIITSDGGLNRKLPVNYFYYIF